MPREAPAAKIVPFYADAGQCRQSPEKSGLGSQRNTLLSSTPRMGTCDESVGRIEAGGSCEEKGKPRRERENDQSSLE